MFYSDIFMDYFLETKWRGELENYSAKSNLGDLSCGDIVEFTIKTDSNIITDIKNETIGCAVSQASSNALCQLIKGKSIDFPKSIDEASVEKIIGEIPIQNKKCLRRAIRGVKSAIDDYLSHQ